MNNVDCDFSFSNILNAIGIRENLNMTTISTNANMSSASFCRLVSPNAVEWKATNKTLTSNNSNTSSTVPADTIKFPILLLSSFNSSKMSSEIACELTERQIPIIREAIMLKKENAEFTSLLNRLFFIIGIPRMTPASIWPMTLGRLKYLNISERKKASTKATSMTNSGFDMFYRKLDY